jgi:hypothetical protein
VDDLIGGVEIPFTSYPGNMVGRTFEPLSEAFHHPNFKDVCFIDHHSARSAAVTHPLPRVIPMNGHLELCGIDVNCRAINRLVVRQSLATNQVFSTETSNGVSTA